MDRGWGKVGLEGMCMYVCMCVLVVYTDGNVFMVILVSRHWLSGCGSIEMKGGIHAWRNRRMEKREGGKTIM